MAALLAPFLSCPGAPLIEDLSTYLELLLRWNARLNLTAVRDPEQIVTRHFGESLFAAAHLFSAQAGPPAAGHCLLDLGSGAGFPGVPIKLYARELRLVLVESKYRKATFLRELARALRLTATEIFAGRAQDYPPPAPGSPLTLTLRAVESFDQVLPAAARLLGSAQRPAQAAGSGVSASASPLPLACPRRLALLIGSGQVERARQLLPDFAWSAPLAIPQSSARVVLVGNLAG